MLLRHMRVVCLAVLGTVAVPLLAAPPDRAVYQSVKVRVGDVDLNSAAGAQKLYGRLQRAARWVCDDDWPARRNLYMRRQIEECKAQAMDDAVARIDRPALTDLHAQRDVDG